MSWTMEAINNCGIIRSGTSYQILKRGLDWYAIKVNGKMRYVDSWVFDKDYIDGIHTQTSKLQRNVR